MFAFPPAGVKERDGECNDRETTMLQLLEIWKKQWAAGHPAVTRGRKAKKLRIEAEKM